MNLLKALVLYVDRSYAPENKNIGQVYQLLTLNAESDLNNLFDTLPATHPAKAPFSLFKQASDSVRSGVIIGLGAAFRYSSPRLSRRLLPAMKLTWSCRDKKPCAYFCITSDQDSTFDFLSSLFLSFCIYQAGEVCG